MNEKQFLHELANQIKIARIRSGNSQAEVLKSTGINVARIEQGNQSIQLITFYRLCKFLKVKPSTILANINAKLSFNDILDTGKN